MVVPKTMFSRYIGIDYSGAATAERPLQGLRVYLAEWDLPACDVLPPIGSSSHWSRSGIAAWLIEVLNQPIPTLVGLDHGFSFPHRYFRELGVPENWPAFLDDFQRHWPTDQAACSVEQVRRGICGNAALRCGSSRWRRITEIRARAKSVFHFDVPGSVAKSTHAGLPWLRRVRMGCQRLVHFWPFDGWVVPAGCSAVVEVYPSLYSRLYPRGDRTADQQDAFAIASWMRDADRSGNLVNWFKPPPDEADQAVAAIEGWILGISG